MSTVDDIRKAVQDFIAPELRTISSELKAMRELMDTRFNGVNQRFDDLMEKLALEKRIATLERDREEKRAS